MSDSGWICLHRKLLEWEWSDSPNTGWLFITLLLMCNHEPQKWHGQTIERGQRVTSLRKLSAQTGLSLQELRTCLSKLEKTGEITRKSTQSNTLITINNYNTYQDRIKSGNTLSNKRATNEQQLTTMKTIYL